VCLCSSTVRAVSLSPPCLISHLYHIVLLYLCFYCVPAISWRSIVLAISEFNSTVCLCSSTVRAVSLSLLCLISHFYPIVLLYLYPYHIFAISWRSIILAISEFNSTVCLCSSTVCAVSLSLLCLISHFYHIVLLYLYPYHVLAISWRSIVLAISEFNSTMCLCSSTVRAVSLSFALFNLASLSHSPVVSVSLPHSRYIRV